MSDTDDELEALLHEVAAVGDGVIAQDAHLARGTRVTDRVRLDALLGRGGMGSVWTADHLTLDRRVAVKFVQRGDEDALKRFSREAKLAAQLNSPHVVRIFDHGFMHDEIPFIVMELLEGESLADRIAREGPLSLTEVGLLVAQVAQVLREAHRLDIVHRDIKPANIFLARSDYALFAKVLDFGIAKQCDVLATGVTGSGTLVGTPLYMAPEQLVDGEPADAQADLWALSAVAFEALTGGPPFAGKTVASVGAALAQRERKLVTQARPGLPDALEGWFERAFAANVADRFVDATALAESFAVAADATTARVANSPRRVARRWFALVGLTAALGLAGWQLAQPRGRSGPAVVPEATAEAPTLLHSVAGATSADPPSGSSDVAPPSSAATTVSPPAKAKPRRAPPPNASPTVRSSPSAPPPATPSPSGRKKGGLITDAPF